MAERDFIFMTIILLLLVKNGAGLSNAKREIQTTRPIIGVLAQSTEGMLFSKLGKTYITASYVKFLESSGARVVPVMNNLTKVEIKKLFKCINGVVFPGGVVHPLTSAYARTASIIFELAVKTFDKGGYFPIMGICLGHELLSTAVNDLVDLHVETETHDTMAPLNLVQEYRESKLFQNIPKKMVKTYNESLITAHFHYMSLPLKSFQNNHKLKKFYRILTTNIDRNGTEYVSTMESKRYPFYALQWHPEKCPFEWLPRKSIPHHSIAIKFSQYVSNFFVQEARYSKHKFLSEEEEKAALIYNYSPTYSGKEDHAIFEQVYIFT